MFIYLMFNTFTLLFGTTFLSRQLSTGQQTCIGFIGTDVAVKAHLAFQLLIKLCADVGKTKDILF